VLKDKMPTANWKNEIWKDGIANIDEELNSLPYNPKAKANILILQQTCRSNNTPFQKLVF